MSKLTCLAILCYLTGIQNSVFAQTNYSEKSVSYNLPDGVYTSEMLTKDFGNGRFSESRKFAEIQNETYKITYIKGMKVNNTGASSQIYIQPGEQYILEYQIKYDHNFESGLHGKQFGFGIGAIYTGGKSDEARQNGDGGSVRLQFDAESDSVSNQLYVYYCEMTGKYGSNPGDQKYSMAKGEWNTIKLKVSMQTNVEKADGRVEVWCNNIKKIDVGNLRFVNKEAGRKITKLLFESFPGGGGIYPTHDNYIYVDNLRWWKSN